MGTMYRLRRITIAKCPKCESTELEVVLQSNPEWVDVKHYVCQKCGCQLFGGDSTRPSEIKRQTMLVIEDEQIKRGSY